MAAAIASDSNTTGKPVQSGSASQTGKKIHPGKFGNRSKRPANRWRVPEAEPNGFGPKFKRGRERPDTGRLIFDDRLRSVANASTQRNTVDQSPVAIVNAGTHRCSSQVDACRVWFR